MTGAWKDGDLRLHPIVTPLVDAETLEKIGTSRVSPVRSKNLKRCTHLTYKRSGFRFVFKHVDKPPGL
jgi:hypothetical protein